MAACPQLENGFTRIANEIMEALAHIRIPGEARQVLDVILRKTYGFMKRSDQISLSQFHLATGMVKPSIVRAIRQLEAMNLISKNANGLHPEYSFNKDYAAWKPLAKKLTVNKNANNRLQKSKKSLAKKLPTKESIKRKYQKKCTIEFERFWSAYPRKVARQEAEKVFSTIKPASDLLERILSSLEKQKLCEQWTKDGGRFIPHAATWLRGRRWEDDTASNLEPKPSAPAFGSDVQRKIAAARKEAGRD